MMPGLTRRLGDKLDANVKQLFAGLGASMCAGVSWLSFLRHDSSNDAGMLMKGLVNIHIHFYSTKIRHLLKMRMPG